MIEADAYSKEASMNKGEESPHAPGIEELGFFVTDRPNRSAATHTSWLYQPTRQLAVPAHTPVGCTNPHTSWMYQPTRQLAVPTHTPVRCTCTSHTPVGCTTHTPVGCTNCTQHLLCSSCCLRYRESPSSSPSLPLLPIPLLFRCSGAGWEGAEEGGHPCTRFLSS